MAGNIHDHISKALKSKGKRTLERNITDESHLDQTVASDSALEERLTSLISPVENDIQTQFYWDQPPLSELNQYNLSEEMVKHIYKRLYNKILEEHDFTNDDATLEEIHTISTNSIVSKIKSKAELYQFDANKAKAICLKARSQEIKTQTICKDIDVLRRKIFDFLTTVNTLPTTNELSYLKDNYNKHTDDPIYSDIQEQVKEIITKGVFSLDESFLIKLLHHIKRLTLISPQDQAMFSSFILKNPSITPPFSLDDIEKLSQDIEEFIKDCPTLQIEKESKFIHHALVYDIELIKMGQINEYFCRFDLLEVKNKCLSLLIENKELLSNIQSNITLDSLQEIDSKLNDCQKSTQEYGYARITSSINKNDYEIISQIQALHKKIIEQSDILNILLNLQSSLETNKSTLSTHVEALDVIIENLRFLNEHLSFLFSTLRTSGFDKPYNENIFLFRLGRGDFFKESDRFPLYLTTFAIHKPFNASNILDLFIDNFNDYSLIQKEICLEFVKNFIILDSSNSMIPIKYESNELIHKFELFCQFVLANLNENTILEDKLNDISNLLINKIVEKGKIFSEYLNDISKNKIPSETLLRNINTINDDFNNNSISISVIEEYCIEINFIIESPLLLLSNDEYTVPLESAISYFCSQLIKIPQFQNSAEDLINKLAQRKNTPSNQQSLPVNKELDLEIENDMCNVIHIINEITQANVTIIDYEKYLNTLVDAIEQGFARRFLKVDISELTETPWINDDLRIHNGLNPKSPNIRIYLQYYNIIAKFFTLAILCKIEKPGTLVFRENILETKRMYDFVEKLVLKAIEKGFVATANTLNSIFKLKDIKRLKMSNIDNKNLRTQFLEEPQMRLSTLKTMIQEKDGLPLIQSIQNQVMMEYQKTYGSEFEKFVRIGQKLRFMEGKKESAKNKIYSQADIVTQIITVFEKGSLLSPHILAEDILISDEIFSEKIEKASFNIKPTEFKEYSIHDIPSIIDFKELLNYWYNRLEDFHFIEKNPEKHIYQHIEQLIRDDENFIHLENTLDILDLIAIIDESNNRVYKNLEHDLMNILSLYYKHVLKHLKSDQSEPVSELETFFSIYNKHSRIKKSRETNISSFNPFSSPKALKEIINKIDHAQTKFNQIMNAYIQSCDQKTYTELLMKVLEGDKQEPIIHFGSPHQVAMGSSSSLLPDSEFPVPQAEPEHPDYIGINRTMNFNPDTSQRSALEIFETKELQKDFQEAFPWSINRSSINQLEHARLNPSINLLATELLFNPPTQMAVMNYVLLALDCLGKISGFNGELAISNFAKIKMISDTLQDVSDLLLISNPDDEYLNVKIDHMTYKLVVLNQDLIDMLQHPNPEYPVQNNTDMNEFCHINEYLTHKLLGIPYQKSILSALNPESNILDAVSVTIRNDFMKVVSNSPVYTQMDESLYSNESDLEE